MSTSRNTLNEKSNLLLVSNLYIAAFLYSKGLTLTDISRTDPRRSQFIFQNTTSSEELAGEELIRLYNYGPQDTSEVLVDARKFVEAIKAIKDRLYQEGV